MYIPPAYAATEAHAHALIRQQVLGTVVWQGADGLQATPLPWLLAADGQELHAHLPRANPLVPALAAGPLDVLISFTGPAAYISPNWYPSKAETERMVPTWNYQVAQLHGRLHLEADPAWVRAQMTALTAQQEAGEPRPWTLDDAAPGFIDQLLRVLVGLRFEIRRVESKLKISQKHSERDRAGMRDGLRAAGDAASLALLDLIERASV